MLTLMLCTLLALAGAVEKIEKLVADGVPDEAVTFAEGWLEKNGDHADADAVKKALRKARFDLAKAANTVESWADFRADYPNGRLSDQALAREAKVAWKAIRETTDRAELQSWLTTYGALEPVAEVRQRDVDLAWAEAKASNSRQGWAAFVKEFPDDARTADARERLMKMAYLEMREKDTPEAYRAFVKRFPRHEHREKISHQLIEKWAKLELPCSGSPPVCDRLDTGSVIIATWERAPDTRVQVTLVALDDDDAAKPLEEAFGEVALAALEMSHDDILRASEGIQRPGRWRLELPFDLLRDQAPGYGVTLHPDGADPIVLPFRVSTAYTLPEPEQADPPPAAQEPQEDEEAEEDTDEPDDAGSDDEG